MANTDPWVVHKFGGSSVADADCFRRVAAILDESHKIKNPDTDLAKVFHRLSKGFARRVIMTGTPVSAAISNTRRISGESRAR